MQKLKQALRWMHWFFNLIMSRKESPSYSLNMVQKSWRDFRLTLNASKVDYNQAYIAILNLVSFLETSKGYKLTKYGPEQGDGAYFIPANLQFDRDISIGVGKSYEFELCLDQKTKVFLFDHTIVAPDNLPPNFQFFRIGVGQNNSATIKDLNQIFEICNAESSSKTLLKIDIEGNEYDVFNHFEYTEKIDILILELHNLNWMLDQKFRNNFINFSRFLYDNFACVFSNGNNNTGVTAFNDLVVANTIEITLVAKKILPKLIKSDEVYMVQNNPIAPQLYPYYVRHEK